MSKHCTTCRCDSLLSEERVRQGKLFSGVPDHGCLDYRNGKYCGQPVDAACKSDRCKAHNHDQGPVRGMRNA